MEVARELGQILAEEKIQLVYGGAQVGLMGVLADSTLEHGGKVVGVLPKVLQTKEIAHPRLTKLILCDSMHERKTKMFELSEGFVAMPGGFGTLEEIFEILTWRQLGLHQHPIAFLNVQGFYDSLEKLFDKMQATELLKSEYRKTALFETNTSSLVPAMRSQRGEAMTPWIQKKQL